MEKYRKSRALPGLAALLLWMLWCSGANAESLVRVGGTGSALPVIRALAKAYTSTHKNVSIKVVPSLGSRGGIAAVGEGALDLAISARPLDPSESRTGAKSVEFARTPFVFAVHKSVPKSDLTTQELVSLFSGNTGTWPNGTVVRIILRPPNDTDTRIVKSISPAMAQAVKSAHLRRGIMIAATNEESAEAVSKIPGGFTGTSLSEMLADNRPVKVLSYNGVKPTLAGLSSGTYPLAKRLFLVLPGRPSSAALDFASFIRSPQAHATLTATGNLPVYPAKGRQ